MELHGSTGSPLLRDNTRVQRKLPSPFKRPSITVGGGVEVKRQWRQVPVRSLNVGDVVADVGMIDNIDEILEIPGRVWDGESTDISWRVKLTNVVGGVHEFGGESVVLAYTAERP